MESNGTRYEFSEKAFQYSKSADMIGWTIVLLPKEISKNIRGHYKNLEEGWGRLKIKAKTGTSEWKTAIWFDTKHETYLLPLKANIRRKEKIEIGKEIKITFWINF